MTTQTQFGQADALALAMVAYLSDNASDLCLPVTVQRRFLRVDDPKDLPDVTQPVQVDILPGVFNDAERYDRTSQAPPAGRGSWMGTFGITLYMQQVVVGQAEAQCPLLELLRTQLLALVEAARLATPAAFLPMQNLVVGAVRSLNKGTYDLDRLVNDGCFSAGFTLTFKASA